MLPLIKLGKTTKDMSSRVLTLLSPSYTHLNIDYQGFPIILLTYSI